MNDKLKKLALNRKAESGSIGNTMHVVLLLCNGACNVNKGCIKKIHSRKIHPATQFLCTWEADSKKTVFIMKSLSVSLEINSVAISLN